MLPQTVKKGNANFEYMFDFWKVLSKH